MLKDVPGYAFLELLAREAQSPPEVPHMLKALMARFVALFVCVAPLAAWAVEPQVEMFSPEGTAKEVRQVTARFSAQMVTFGDPRLLSPFDVKCPEKGRGRWIDGRTWSYDFEKDLPAGIACTFTLKEDTRSLSGEAIAGRRQFSFTTGGPSIVDVEPWRDHQAIQQDQAFIVILDAEADETSVLQQVYCSVEGIKERVGIRLLKGKAREEILKATGNADRKEPVLVFQCRQTLPARAEVKIVWGKGVLSKGGIGNSADQVLPFKAQGPFEAKLSCLRERPKAGCIPVTPMKLVFTATVPLDVAKKITLRSDKGKVWPARPGNDDGEEFVDSVVFDGPFPESTWLTLTVPPKVKDDSGRILSNGKSFPLRFKTDAYPPLAKFAADFGILEFGPEAAALPLTVRNIEAQVKAFLLKAGDGKESGTKGTVAARAQKGGTSGGITAGDKGNLQRMPRPVDEKMSPGPAGTVRQVRIETEENIIRLLDRLEETQRDKSILKGKEGIRRLTIPKPGGSKEFEVIGVPFTEPGFYVVEVESAILGAHLLEKRGPMYVPTAALVTNMAAHFKQGRESSLVWVTGLDAGEPIIDASVTIRSCSGKDLWQGRTDENGLARIPTALPAGERCNSMSSEYGHGLFVFARKGRDMTFTHSTWQNGIEPWRYNLARGGRYDRTDLLAHTIFDRTLLKAGETLNMKHVLREGSTRGMVIPRQRVATLNQVVIEHVGSEQEYRLPLDWMPDGTAESVWEVPSGAKLGTYNVFFGKKMSDQSRSLDRILSGSFRVEEFRVPLAKGFILGPKTPAVAANEIEIDVGVNYLSGGAASLLPVRIRSEARSKSIRFSDYEEFVFANGKVKEGVEEPVGSAESPEEEEGGGTQAPSGEVVGKEKPGTIDLKLDANGAARTKIRGIQQSDSPKDMVVEIEFRDPNGEIQTSSTRIALYPSMVLTGISTDTTARTSINTPISYRVAVLDLQGKPVAGSEVRVALLQRKEYSHRRRITGGFYAYENTVEVKPSGTTCQGKTDEDGILTCELRPAEGGNIILQAEARDALGNVSTANRDLWITGDDRWFEGRNDDRMDVLPEKREYQAGETARLQVKMPFQGAVALVTVEREGVIDAYVRRVSRKDPFIEIPVKGNYAPNVFVSVLAVRGRLGEVKPTAMFDPGKPSYKLGITEIKVGWQPHELKVKVSPLKQVYKTRDLVEVSLRVTSATGRALPKGTNAAIAVIDEGLLELKSNDSWKLLESMMRKRPYEVRTSTAQMMVVGKRHFGKKALPHGGGGGRATTRELFEALVYWNGRVPIDENGRGRVRFKLNDSLTSFKIVAIATGGADLFGTGDTTIRSTQDLMILSGLPPLVREGDRFRAGFTLRNTSQRAMDAEASVSLLVGKERKNMNPVRQRLAPGQAHELAWDVTVPFGETDIIYEAIAKEKEGEAMDRLKVSQKVVKTVPVRVLQATLTQLREPLALEVERPSDAVSDQGGVQAVVKPRIADGLTGVIRYMKDYPYVCLEQKVSRAVALRDRKLWDGVMGELSSYLDEQGLVKYFAIMMQGDDILTSYVLALSHESGYPLPKNVKERMMGGLKEFVQGKIRRNYPLPMADLTLRKIAALEALSRFDAVPEGALDTIVVEPNVWPNSAVIDWIALLLRTPNLPERDARLKQAKTILRSRLNLQGTTMTLSVRRDEAWWLMTTPEVDMVKTILTSLELPDWHEDVPRLVRGALGRLRRGHWGTTPANVWGVLAMEKFSKRFESQPVTGLTTARLGGKGTAVHWAKTPAGETLSFPWGRGKETVRVAHEGPGHPWITVQSLAAIPWKQPFSSGYTIKKKVVPIERKAKDSWGVGDVMRVQLEIDGQSDMTWVVVNDPIPAGSTILGGGLGRDSNLLSAQAAFEKGWAWETYRERAFEGLRAYFEYVPKGTWTVEYVLRLNNAGNFLLPETRVEALYAPEMFGVLPNKVVVVNP